MSLKDEIVDAEIWRYMDFAKFVSLLTNESLYFCKLKNLDDPWEGEWPSYYDIALKKMICDSRPPSNLKDDTDDIFAQTITARNIFYDCIYVNCWHINDYESDAMWKLYALNKEGIAIKTTIHKLCDQLDKQNKEFHINQVKYIDHRKELPEDVKPISITAPIFFKSKAFEHERELRVTLSDKKLSQSITIYPGENINKYVNELYGVSISVNLIELIDAIHISPLAPSWLVPVIQSLLKKYNLEVNVNSSLLKQTD